jgi:hypothetical protein
MQSGAEEVAELPAVIGIERRLEKLPYRVQAEGQARDRKLREPFQHSGQHYQQTARRSLRVLPMTEGD